MQGVKVQAREATGPDCHRYPAIIFILTATLALLGAGALCGK
jgi:hypothetical protein